MATQGRIARHLALALALGSATPVSPAVAQVGAGTVVLSTRLGGDSAQAALARLRAGATYRVTMRPATPLLQIRPPAHDTTRTLPVPLRPLRTGDSVPGGSGALFTVGRGGDHVVELTEAVAVPVAVEVTLVALAPGDVLPRTGTATLVASEIVSDAPTFVTLDSGVVYRIVPNGTVYLAPRLLNQPPVRIAPLVSASGTGVPFIPPYTGEYRLYGDANEGPVAVRIYLDEADQRELSCVRNPSQRGCRGAADLDPRARGHESLKVLLVAAIILLFNVR